VSNVKINFVAGLLNRFFAEFLLSFKIKDFQNTMKKFGNTTLMAPADLKRQEEEAKLSNSKDKKISVGIKEMRAI